MPRSAAVVLVLFACALPARADSPDKADDLFGLTKLHAMHLILTEQAWEDIQPLQGVRPNAPRDRRPEQPGSDRRQAVVSQFGYEFPYVKGNVEFQGQLYKDVAMRFKGNSAYMAGAEGLKRPLKLEFDRHVDGQRFYGLKSLNLCNNALDSTQMREVLSYEVYRAAGVPSPRTAYAELYLTVPGRFEREFVGLYTLIEQIDRIFIKDRFHTGQGLLLKPERQMGLPHYGDDWTAYVERYQPKTAGNPAAIKNFIAFTKLLRDADDATFQKEIGNYLDVDEFLRYVAATVVLANMDSFLALGHNYYMHVHPDTKKVVFLPWDLNLSFGGLMFANADQQMDMSIKKPYATPNRLVDRVLAMKEYDEPYRRHLKALVTGCFKPETMKAKVAAIHKVIKEPLDREAKLVSKREPPPQPMWAMMTKNMPTLETFVDRRAESITKQLEGKSEGKTITMGFFQPPPKPKPGQKPPRNPFSGGTMLAGSIMKAADVNKDGKLTPDEVLFAAGRIFHELDQNKDNVVDGREVVEGLTRLTAGGFAMLGMPAAAKWEQPARLKTKRKPPTAMGMGFFLADPLLKFIDANHDDKVTLEEWLAAVNRFFEKADKDKKGAIDKETLTDALEAMLPPPPGFSDDAPVAEVKKDTGPKKEK